MHKAFELNLILQNKRIGNLNRIILKFPRILISFDFFENTIYLSRQETLNIFHIDLARKTALKLLPGI